MVATAPEASIKHAHRIGLARQ